MEHQLLIEAAFVNYLTADHGWSDGLLILAGEDNVDKNSARIVAYVEGDLGEEDPPLSGNRWALVNVELRTPFSKLTSAEQDAGAVNPMITHQANADALQTAILSETLPDELTASVGGFRCFGLSERTPTRENMAQYWSSGWKVRIYSCPSEISV